MVFSEENFTEDLSAADLGGKGLNLLKLRDIGMLIPPTLVVSPSFFIQYDENYLQQILKTSSYADRLFGDHALFAVRSSSVDEDGVHSAFAGMFETILDVKKSNIDASIEKVLKSAFSASARKYATEKNINLGSMAVVIQPMIKSAYSGVAFSADPTTGSNKTCLVELVQGSCDKLVSGKVSPTIVRFNKLTEQLRVVQNPYNVPKPEIDSIVHELNDLIPDVCKGLEMNTADIEWAQSDRKLILLQARPITT